MPQLSDVIRPEPIEVAPEHAKLGARDRKRDQLGTSEHVFEQELGRPERALKFLDA